MPRWEGIYFHSRSPVATLNGSDFTFLMLNDRGTVNHVAWEMMLEGDALVFSVWVLTGCLRDQSVWCFSQLENPLSMKGTDYTFKINLGWTRCCLTTIPIFKSWSTSSIHLKLSICSIWDMLNSSSLLWFLKISVELVNANNCCANFITTATIEKHVISPFFHLNLSHSTLPKLLCGMGDFPFKAGTFKLHFELR